ncbi:hypothetical protein [Bacillus sp. P14.5]|uniref:hypothetical protein n=1 Tax=Bacillus sp. P14.5 TaxID=1983400 RepID=UPI000DE8D5B8|nr:hypothetical protein [Bacillus sp. P14.5]
MKLLRILFIIVGSIILGVGSFRVSEAMVENLNTSYVPERPLPLNTVEEQDESFNADASQDVDKLISHSVKGSGTTSLPVDTDESYIIYEDALYLNTSGEGEWAKVPDDDMLGYARISDYLETISESNIFVSKGYSAVVYGGRGSENISIMKTYDEGISWSVGTISKTATRDLEKGYDDLFIDFSEDQGTGYLAAVRSRSGTEGEALAFRSVNSGVTWDPVSEIDELYVEILSRFELQVEKQDEE